MKLLKNIFLCNYFYLLILILSILCFVYYNSYQQRSVYKSFDNEIFTIVDIKDCDYKIQLELKGKELVLGYLYDLDYKDFLNNYKIGDKVIISGEKKDIFNNTVFNTFNYKKYLYHQGILNVININSIDKISSSNNIFYKLKNYLLFRTFKLKKSYSYINSLLLGNNDYMDDNIIEAYRSNGISHLFAVSGLHVSFFFLLLKLIFHKLRFKEKLINFLLIVFLFFYMFITDFSPSILRCGVFNILTILFSILKIKVNQMNILILDFSILIFINPFYLFNIGFQYSFLVSFALILSNKIISKYSYFIKILFISFVAFIFSYPVSINNFYEVNFLSIILNLFFPLYVSFILLPFSFISFLFPVFDNAMYFLIRVIESVSLFFEHMAIFNVSMCKLNVLIILLYYVMLCLILSHVKRCVFLKLFVFFFFFCIMHFSNFFKQNNILHFFDVGQGDSILYSVNNNNILIDSGGVVKYNDNQYTYSLSSNKIIPFLKSYGIKKLDYFILTHGDYDHMGEAINLINNFKVEKVIFNCGEFNELENELIKVLDKKKIPYYSCIKELNMDDNKLYFLNNKDYGNENDNSSVIYTELNNHKFLFMGDAGIEVEEDLIEKYNLKDIDVLKVGHHGSKTSSGKTFIDEINPKYSIISVGKNNRYGHPNDNVLENLESSKIYRTDQDGSIMFKFKNNKLEIETCSP